MRIALIFLVLAVAALPAQAQSTPAAEPQTKTQPAPSNEISKIDRMLTIVKALSDYFTQDEINLLYTYFRDRLITSITGVGEADELPPDLMFRMQILEKRFEREGKQYLEEAARELEAYIASKKSAILGTDTGKK
jgi:hypothetical protein